MYFYNGVNWRITKLEDTNKADGYDQQRQMYYSANWQLLEEDINDDYPSSSDPTRRVQYIWGLRYIDDLICSRVKNLPSGNYVTRYHLTDAQFSTVALLSSSGTLLERVAYDPYGEARHQWPGDLDGDGAVTTTEITAIYNIGRGSNNAIGEVNYDVEADLNRDGVVNSTDYQMVNGASAKSALPKGDLSAPGIGNIIGYCGYVFNGETITATTGAMYTVRHRHYAPDLGRWIERDPIGYVDGMSLYEYVRSQVLRYGDPYGMRSEVQIVCRDVRHRSVQDFATHCAIIACCHDPKTDAKKCVRYELGGENPDGSGRKQRSQPGPLVIAPDEISYQVESYDDACVRESGDSEEAPCALANCIANAFDAIDIPKYRAVLGPNSNTFARMLLERCDLRFKPFTGLRQRVLRKPPVVIEVEETIDAPEGGHGWGLYSRKCECERRNPPPRSGRGIIGIHNPFASIDEHSQEHRYRGLLHISRDSDCHDWYMQDEFVSRMRG